MRWLLLAVLVVACVEDRRASGPVFDVRVERKVLRLQKTREVDLLVVVDNARNMAAHRERLRENLPNLASVLATSEGGLPQIHIGFTTANCDDGAVRAASTNGRFLAEADGVTNFEGRLGAAMLASFDALPASGCSAVEPLRTILNALDHPANTDFFRDYAQLYLVILTANDDHSPVTTTQIKDRLRDPSTVMVSAAIGPCRDEVGAAGDAPRLRAFLAEFPNRSTSIPLCQEDLSGVVQLLSGLGIDLSGNPCFDVEIPDPPECSASIFPDEEQLVPPCTDGDVDVCWRIDVDAAQCPGGSAHQLVVFDHYIPTPRRVPAIVECVVPSP